MNVWMSPDNAGWVGHLLTITGVIVGALIVIYQLGRQHRSALKLQRSNAKGELKLKVYEALSSKIRPFAEACGEAQAYASAILRHVELNSDQNQRGVASMPVQNRAKQMMDLHYRASTALTELMVAIEKWEIAFRSGELFRVALTSANHDVESAFHPYLMAMLPLLPLDREDGTGGVIDPQHPSQEQLAHFRSTAERYNNARSEIRMYVHDLVVESQNTLLSKLFNRRVPIRKPLDPKIKVIIASEASELLRYFKSDTEMGRAHQEAERDVIASVQARDGTGSTAI